MRLLLGRGGGLGDLIMLTAAVRSLLDANPEIEVFLVTSEGFVNLFRGLPVYQDVFFRIPEGFKFDKLLELTGAVEAPQVGGTLPWAIYAKENRIDIFESLLGLNEHPSVKYPMIRVNDLSVQKIRNKIGYKKDYTWIVVQTTCATPVRSPHPDTLCRLFESYHNHANVRFVYTGGEPWFPSSARNLFNSGINLMGQLSVEEYVALISLADIVIAPDSSGPHIAAALRKNCVALFGNIDPYTRVHYYPTVRAIYPKNQLPCIPCGDNSFSQCQRVWAGQCMKQIDNYQIYRETRGWL